jgi:hypothetical protein
MLGASAALGPNKSHNKTLLQPRRTFNPRSLHFDDPDMTSLFATRFYNFITCRGVRMLTRDQNFVSVIPFSVFLTVGVFLSRSLTVYRQGRQSTKQDRFLSTINPPVFSLFVEVIESDT